MSDKIHELAEKLAQEPNVFVPRLAADGFERILRAELEPLLKAAQATVDNYGWHKALAAELQNWTARNPDGR